MLPGMGSGLNTSLSLSKFVSFSQGLSDTEEFVITSCIKTMSELNEISLLKKVDIDELLKETLPYLAHPSLWIRTATAGSCAHSGK